MTDDCLMILLAIDTSGKDGSIALARALEASPSADELEILDLIPLEGGTFSAQLVPQIATLLAKHGKRKEDIGAFAVASGPGSFTGLRVGLAVIKALAEVLNKPIVAISLMEAIAHEIMLSTHAFEDFESSCAFAIALDASRKEVFLAQGEFDRTALIPKHYQESLVTLAEVAELANRWGREREIYTPDRIVLEFVEANVSDPFLFKGRLVDRPNSMSVARLGLVKVLRGETVSPEDLEANYIRRTDAEIFAKRS
jgi:tRNA threonylcarbamoyladenosine biosynthesis protein TsaB